MCWCWAPGGAASAAVCALLDGGAAEIVVRNRSPERARALVERYAAEAEGRLRLGPAEGAPSPDDEFDLAVNATPLGVHAGDPLPLPHVESISRAALDLAYSPHETAWVRHARDAGLRAADGREMLLLQAAAAFQRWTGRPAPLAVMRAALTASAAHHTRKEGVDAR